MNFIYPFLIAFAMVFACEFGDKTQLLVLSVSGKDKTYKILLGVAIGSFFSHGIAILFGSHVGLLENHTLHHVLELITYSSFVLIGLLGLIPKKEVLTMNSKEDSIFQKSNGKCSIFKKFNKEKPSVLTKKLNFFHSFFQKIANSKINYCILIALFIMIGELGDKTFLASIGLGIKYPEFKLLLIFGAIAAMVVCNFIAIIFGKFLTKHVSEKNMKRLSSILFLLFGILGFISI